MRVRCISSLLGKKNIFTYLKISVIRWSNTSSWAHFWPILPPRAPNHFYLSVLPPDKPLIPSVAVDTPVGLISLSQQIVFPSTQCVLSIQFLPPQVLIALLPVL